MFVPSKNYYNDASAVTTTTIRWYIGKDLAALSRNDDLVVGTIDSDEATDYNEWSNNVNRMKIHRYANSFFSFFSMNKSRDSAENKRLGFGLHKTTFNFANHPHIYFHWFYRTLRKNKNKRVGNNCSVLTTCFTFPQVIVAEQQQLEREVEPVM